MKKCHIKNKIMQKDKKTKRKRIKYFQRISYKRTTDASNKKKNQHI